MFMSRRKHRRLVQVYEQRLQNEDQARRELQGQSVKLLIRLELVEQAREKADADARYWRERAERFLDQIGLRHGIITAPTMSPAPADEASSQAQSVFTALGIAEINHKDSGPGAAAAAPRVTGVDPTAAQAAVDAVLADL